MYLNFKKIHAENIIILYNKTFIFRIISKYIFASEILGAQLTVIVHFILLQYVSFIYAFPVYLSYKLYIPQFIGPKITNFTFVLF